MEKIIHIFNSCKIFGAIARDFTNLQQPLFQLAEIFRGSLDSCFAVAGWALTHDRAEGTIEAGKAEIPAALADLSDAEGSAVQKLDRFSDSQMGDIAGRCHPRIFFEQVGKVVAVHRYGAGDLNDIQF